MKSRPPLPVSRDHLAGDGAVHLGERAVAGDPAVGRIVEQLQRLHRLISREIGRALCHEGGDALAIIVRVAKLAHRVALAVELGVEAVAPAFADHLLDPGEPPRRPGGEARGERVDLRVELVVVDRFPDQAPFCGLLRAERLAGQREAERAGLADQPRQHPGAAAVGNEADRGEGLDELRALRGDDDVAGERDIGAGAGGDAVHAGDHRHRQRGQRADQRIVALLDRLAEIDRLAGRHRAVAQILPGAEAAAGAGQDQGPRVAETAKRVGHLLVHLDGEAVEPVGAVEGEAGDAGLQLELDGFVSHGAPMTANEIADKVARAMLAAEGTGPAWGDRDRGGARRLCADPDDAARRHAERPRHRPWRHGVRARRHRLRLCLQQPQSAHRRRPGLDRLPRRRRGKARC